MSEQVEGQTSSLVVVVDCYAFLNETMSSFVVKVFVDYHFRQLVYLYESRYYQYYLRIYFFF